MSSFKIHDSLESNLGSVRDGKRGNFSLKSLDFKFKWHFRKVLDYFSSRIEVLSR